MSLLKSNFKMDSFSDETCTTFNIHWNIYICLHFIFSLTCFVCRQWHPPSSFNPTHHLQPLVGTALRCRHDLHCRRQEARGVWPHKTIDLVPSSQPFFAITFKPISKPRAATWRWCYVLLRDNTSMTIILWKKKHIAVHVFIYSLGSETKVGAVPEARSRNKWDPISLAKFFVKQTRYED